MPERLQMMVNPRKYGFRRKDIPAPVAGPDAEVRLYIAPVNFAGQGYRWARAAEQVSGVGAVSMQYRNGDDYGFPCDYSLPTAVYAKSAEWAKRQFKAVSADFTHVIIEAERPIFGPLFGGDVLLEISTLQRTGMQVAMVSHGSDLRVPSMHRNIDRWSPFHDDEWSLTPRLEQQARANLAILEAAGVPVFVSTPGLREYWPEARWLPVAVDPGAWATDRPVLVRDRPIVVHAPSRGVVKGTALVRVAMEPLHEENLIEYREVQGVPAWAMPAIYQDADIVIDAMRIGNYGVAACEAMAAGRLVIGHLHKSVMTELAEAGAVPPIIAASPDELTAQIRDVLADREAYRKIAAEGPGFVRRNHDGTRAAESMRPFLTERIRS
jgi:hypothetical protein